jgi:hypothetical protein
MLLALGLISSTEKNNKIRKGTKKSLTSLPKSAWSLGSLGCKTPLETQGRDSIRGVHIWREFALPMEILTVSRTGSYFSPSSPTAWRIPLWTQHRTACLDSTIFTFSEKRG